MERFFKVFVICKLRLIKYSKDLEELDLHNNTMGNMSARLILNALEYRKSCKNIQPNFVI